MPRLLLAALLAALTLGAADAHAQEASAGAPALGLAKAFQTPTIGPGSATTLTFTVSNNLETPQTGIGFTDPLPVSVTIADPARATTTCPSSVGALTATLSAPDGGSTLTLSDARLAANSSCTVSVDVTSATPGTHTNVTGAITSDTETGSTASADLSVSTSLPGFSKSFAPSTVVQGGRSTLTFLIDNTSNGNAVANLDFTDALPSGMVVASPANASTTCGTATIPPTLTATAGSSTVTLDADGSTASFSYFPAVDIGATCTVTVDVLATATGDLDNATQNLLVDFVSAGFASATLTSLSGGALSLSKAFVTNPVAPGAATTLRFTLRNNSRTEAATALTFTDYVAGGTGTAATETPLSDVCGAGSQLSGTTLLTLTGGTLGPEEECVFDVALLVPSGATPGTYVNTTSGVSGMVGGDAVAGAAASASLFVAYVPTLTKEFTDDPVTAGGDVTLEFTITNTDPTGAATDLAFVDILSTFLPTPLVTDIPLPTPLPHPPFVVPGGREDVCGPGSLLDYAYLGTEGDGIQLTGGTLAAGASCTFSVVITIPEGFAAGTYTNTTREITGTVGGATVAGPPASDDLVVVAGPRLLKAFTPDAVSPGSTTALQFTLSLDAGAAGDATGIGFTDNLSDVLSGLLPTAGQLPLAACGGTLRLQGAAGFGIATVLEFVGGTLSPGDRCEFEVSLDVPASPPYGTVANTTSAVSATVDGLALTSPAATASLTVTPFRLSKWFFNMRQATPTVLYGIENADPSDIATSLTFTDPLGGTIPGLTFGALPADPCGAGSSLQDLGSGSLLLTGGTVAPGTHCAFQVPLVLPAGLDARLYSSTSGDLSGQLDGVTYTAPGATSSFTLLSQLPLFSKAFTPSTILTGGTSRLTFAIDNTAQSAAATGFGFTDPFPAGMVIADPTNASTTCSGGMGDATPGASSFSFAGGSVAARERCTVSIDVTAAAEGTYANTSEDLTSSAGNSGPATATLTVVDPAVYATKAVTFTTDGDSDGKADAGDVLHYTVTVHNRSAAALSGLTFSDTPGASSTLVGGSVTAIPGTVTSGDQPTDTEVTVALGTIPSMGSATVVFDVTVADPLPESVGSICNQGTVRGGFGTAVTGDPATPDLFDPTCVAAERPALDVVITSHTGAARGETLRVFATVENTTAGPLHYRPRLFLTDPDGKRTPFPADRFVIQAGQTTAAALVAPEVPIAADAPAGTYVVEVVGVVIDPPVIVDTERFEFTLPPLSGAFAEVDLATVRPGAGPNPFLRRTTLRFPVLEATRVDLRVFDASGREVAVLVDGRLPRGVHEAEFDGASRPAGVYFWRLTVDGEVTTGAVTLVR